MDGKRWHGGAFHGTRVRGFIVLMIALTLVGCSDVVLRDQSERDVNEMIAVLDAEGVKAWKHDNGKEQFSLRVSSGELARAVNVLNAAGLPRNTHAGMEQALGERGMLSSPLEENVRFIHALSEELSASLSMIDGVLNARVHLVVPDVPAFSDRAPVSSASILIRHRESHDVAALSGRIKLFVQKSVENLDYDAISIVFIPSTDASIARESGTTAHSDGLALSSGTTLAGVSFLLFVLGGALVHPGTRGFLRRACQSRRAADHLSVQEAE